MLKYEHGNDGYYAGAVLKSGKQGIIYGVVRRPGGEWGIRFGEDGSKYAFLLWGHFPNDGGNKTSLAELTREEFNKTMQSLGPQFQEEAKEELNQCYMVLKRVYNYDSQLNFYKNDFFSIWKNIY